MAAPVVKLQLPKFDGSETPLQARVFMRKAEAFGAVLNYSQAQIAQAVCFALNGAASRWIGTYEEGGDARIDEWDTLKPLFQERFCRPLSSTEISQLIRDLKQKDTEAVDEFHDRCHEVQYLKEASLDPAVRAAIDDVAFDALHKEGVLQLFLNGLQPKYRDKVANDSTAASLEAFVRSARRAESSYRDSRPAGSVLEFQNNGNGNGSGGVPQDGHQGGDEGACDQDGQQGGVDAMYRGSGGAKSGNSVRGNSGSGTAVSRFGNDGREQSTSANPNSFQNARGNTQGGQGGYSSGARADTRTCYECGRQGHIRPNCPNLAAGGVRNGGARFSGSSGKLGGSGSGGGGFKFQGKGSLAEVLGNLIISQHLANDQGESSAANSAAAGENAQDPGKVDLLEETSGLLNMGLEGFH